MTAVETRTDVPRDRRVAGVRVPGRVFRPRRMVPATIVAGVIFVVAAMVAAGIVAGLAGRRIDLLHAEAITSWLARLHWDDPGVRIIAAVVALAGLVLVRFALAPGRPRVVALATETSDVLMGVTRRGLCRVAAAAAGDVDGVERVRARARGRRIRLTVRTPLRDRADAKAVAERARVAAEQALDHLDLAHPARLKVRVRRSR